MTRCKICLTEFDDDDVSKYDSHMESFADDYEAHLNKRPATQGVESQDSW